MALVTSFGRSTPGSWTPPPRNTKSHLPRVLSSGATTVVCHWRTFNSPTRTSMLPMGHAKLCATACAATVSPINASTFSHSQQCCRVSISNASRLPSSMACARICAHRYNALDAVPGIQTFPASSFTCLNHGRQRNFAIWSHRHTRITRIYPSHLTRMTPCRHPKQSRYQKINESAKDPWHMFKHPAVGVGSK